jgi:hypothetical protein
MGVISVRTRAPISVIFRSSPVKEEIRRLYGSLQPVSAVEGQVANLPRCGCCKPYSSCDGRSRYCQLAGSTIGGAGCFWLCSGYRVRGRCRPVSAQRTGPPCRRATLCIKVRCWKSFHATGLDGIPVRVQPSRSGQEPSVAVTPTFSAKRTVEHEFPP